MLASTHFAVTTGILLLAYQFSLPLTKKVILITYLAGFCVDFDHLVLYPQKCWYFFRQIFKQKIKENYGKYYLRSFLQEPFFALLVWLISIFIYFQVQQIVVFLPALALTVHIFLDILMKNENKLLWPFSKKGYFGWMPVNSWLEYFLSIILSVLFLILALKLKLFLW